MRWFALGFYLFLAGFGVWLLLIAYRVVGKPPGADERSDAWHRTAGKRLGDLRDRRCCNDSSFANRRTALSASPNRAHRDCSWRC